MKRFGISRVFAGLLFVGTLAVPVQANTITYNSIVPALSSPWTQSIAIPQFNSALGNLTGVELQVSLNITATITFINTLWSNGCTGTTFPAAGCLNPQPVHTPDGGQDVASASATIPFTVSGPTGLVNGTVVAGIPGPVVVPAKANGIFPFLCLGGSVHGSFVDEGGCIPGSWPFPQDGMLSIFGLTSNTTTPWTSMGIAGWAGNGFLNLNLNASTQNTDCFQNAHEGVFVGCGAVVGGDVSVRYTFDDGQAFDNGQVPEPGTSMLIGGALLGLGVLRRRKVRS